MRIQNLGWALCLILVGATATAEAKTCKAVKGQFDSVPNSDCPSPVGMCTIGSLTGALKGGYELTMANLIPAGHPTIPAVFFYTGISVVSTHKGMLVGTDAGSIDLNPFGSGKFTALLNITDGTGSHDGAKGYLQIRGTLDFATGGASGDYSGEICTR